MEDTAPLTTPESIPAETIPAATQAAGPTAETPESASIPTETPNVSVVEEPPAEGEVAPLETPTVAAMAEREDEGPGEDEASLDRGPTERQLEILAGLQSYGPGAELPGDVWLNSEPLELADLRGKVVMVEFWTFG
jgi:hypothetical protein